MKKSEQFVTILCYMEVYIKETLLKGIWSKANNNLAVYEIKISMNRYLLNEHNLYLYGE